MAKFGRNKPCWCGSGIKYKRCHYPKEPLHQVSSGTQAFSIEDAIQRSKVSEELRTVQQGKGRPVISTRFQGYQVVAAGDEVFFSKKWRTFTDFLFEYLWVTLGKPWVKEQMETGIEAVHPILEWFSSIQSYQKVANRNSDGLIEDYAIGAFCCLIGLAYNLYLIKHNAELQKLLVSRLKDIKQFQGAYYELIVANCLIRAGFELELEDESDTTSKHCEFSAFLPSSGKKYWVEAKMRAQAGLLGKSQVDGSKGSDPTSQVAKHVSAALKKPSPDDRLIFVDVNAKPEKDVGEPSWSPKAYDRLIAREKNLEEGQTAYVFVTNFPFHWEPESSHTAIAVLAFGLGIPNFAKVGPVTLTNAYKAKIEHADAHAILDSIRLYPQIPETFDGMPREYQSSRSGHEALAVGCEYFFEGSQKDGTSGVLKQVLVNPSQERATLLVETPSGNTVLLDGQLTKDEVAGYRKYGNSFFGDLKPEGKQAKSELELFEFFVEGYSTTSKERLLELAAIHPKFELLKELEREDLLYAICEYWVASTRK